MKRKLILLTAMLFALSSTLFASETTVRRSSNLFPNIRSLDLFSDFRSLDLFPNLTIGNRTERPLMSQQRGRMQRGYSRNLMLARRSVNSGEVAVSFVPFNGTNLDGWKFKSITDPPGENLWKVGSLKVDDTTFELIPLQRNEKGYLLNMTGFDWREKEARKGLLIYTEKTFGDCTIKLEFLVPKGSNSGVYLMGEYEVQINAETFGKPDERLGQGDMGAIYSAAKALTNACGEPGTWQKYEIEFVAPKFDADGNKTSNALFKKVTLNGKVVQENVEVKGPTGGGLTMKEAAAGPLMFQGDHGPVAFRNVKIILP